MPETLIQHVTKTPGVCGGSACIAGHRIRVSDIVTWHERRQYSPDQIVDMFPGITLADVYAALAHYFDHRDEIEAEMQRGDEWGGWLTSHIPSKIPGRPRETPGE